METDEKRRAEETKKRETDRRRRESFMAERYSDVYFRDVKLTENNEQIVQKAKNYVKGSTEAMVKNLGAYVWGSNSSGKTHLTSAMCNELLEKGYSCFYTNLNFIMQNSSLFEDENEIREKVKTVNFMFLDDLGKDFLGREYNSQSSKFAEKILYETINARYNAQLPTIFSSNYSLAELSETLNLDPAIVARINEMSTTVWHLTGDDFRATILEEKEQTVKKLGI